MTKLLKLSTTLVWLGCLNHSANVVASTVSNNHVATGVLPQTKTTASTAQNTTSSLKPAVAIPQIYCDSVASLGDGFAPVPGQPNTYQLTSGIRSCGEPISPLGFTHNPPAGAKLLDRSGKVIQVIPPISGSPAHYNNPPIVAPVAVAAVPVPIITSSPKPIAAPVATPAPNPASVQWMPTIYYRYPGLGGMIYVNDNNGIAYVQHSDGTKTTLPPVPNGQFLRRPAEYHLPVWLFVKLTQNPTDNDEYFVAADRTTPQNRIISVGADGALQVKYVTQNQWIGRNGVVHQVPPVGSEGVVHQVTPSSPVAAAPVALNPPAGNPQSIAPKPVAPAPSQPTSIAPGAYVWIPVTGRPNTFMIGTYHGQAGAVNYDKFPPNAIYLNSDGTPYRSPKFSEPG